MSTVSFINNQGYTFIKTFYTNHKDFQENTEAYIEMFRDVLKNELLEMGKPI